MIDRQWSHTTLYTSLLYNRILVYALKNVVNWGYTLAKEKGPACSQPVFYKHLPLLAYAFKGGGESREPTEQLR
jgi:hypothetical protein